MSTERTVLRIGEMLLRFGPDVVDLIEQIIDAITKGQRLRAGLLASKAATLAAYKAKIRGA